MFGEMWISAAGASNSRHRLRGRLATPRQTRSEEHTSELQSRLHLVCRLLLEKKRLAHWSLPVAQPATSLGDELAVAWPGHPCWAPRRQVDWSERFTSPRPGTLLGRSSRPRTP